MWSYLKGYVAEESVFLAQFPASDKTLINAAIEEKWERIWKIRELANKKIEEKRTAKEIGHSLDTKVIIDPPMRTTRPSRSWATSSRMSSSSPRSRCARPLRSM
jgi:isoleucyl-tRNA synthetase